MNNISIYTDNINEGILSFIKNLGNKIWGNIKSRVSADAEDIYYTIHDTDYDGYEKFNLSNLVTATTKYESFKEFVENPKLKRTDYGKAMQKLISGKVEGYSIDMINSKDTEIKLVIYKKIAVIAVVFYNEKYFPKPYFKSLKNIAGFENKEKTSEQLDKYINKLAQEITKNHKNTENDKKNKSNNDFMS